MAPTLVLRAGEDWSEIETLLASAPSAAVGSVRARPSRLLPLLSAAVVATAAGAAAIPAVRNLYRGTPADVPTIAAARAPAGHAARDLAGNESSSNVTEGRSAAESEVRSAPAPATTPRHRKHHAGQ